MSSGGPSLFLFSPIVHFGFSTRVASLFGLYADGPTPSSIGCLKGLEFFRSGDYVRGPRASLAAVESYVPGPISSGKLKVCSGNLLRLFLVDLCEVFIADDLRDYFSVPGSSKRFFPSLKVLGWVTVPFLTPEAA